MGTAPILGKSNTQMRANAPREQHETNAFIARLLCAFAAQAMKRKMHTMRERNGIGMVATTSTTTNDCICARAQLQLCTRANGTAHPVPSARRVSSVAALMIGEGGERGCW
ncbi:unnamed protein product [Ceratitis capitata]|uniref:(Mediterranean fruit fly) hypothetical protein n=1 Tax=Ceratitis capitata TaxID=7213 RepID=A0A811UR37_CERCA|nr:unnamed protein product [Ceratitis capitata]